MNVKSNIDNLSTIMTGITYINTSNIDLTIIDNNLMMPYGNNFILGGTSIKLTLDSLTGITYGMTTNLSGTTFQNRLTVNNTHFTP